MLNELDISAIIVTIKLALLSTAILILIGTPLAWWLSQTKFKFKVVFEAIIALPLILPPTVLGFYLLVTLGSNGPIGKLLESLGGSSIAFTFSGLVVGSVIYSLPFVVQPLQNSFSSIGRQSMEVAATLGASKLDRFFTVAVPLARSGFITAAVLGFAHTVGEFGVVLMIGGNIPGETGVLSIAIYDHVEAMEYGQAHLLAGGLLITSFLMLIFVYIFNRHFSIMRSRG
ncbi:MAG: molybdate ABC transporter permease subunit [Thiotrichales bacterium]|jgi:molybdate transport system permease protein|nr:molybdate ABC transporter permease subunit [Thiotrichales bacterium]MBT3854058.1 molybdate ABC transporter permease subunit [Thiotrichales bacterium]MBT7438266.1 molybdate ABC transporter permease subunit [Thiotrichales bacterium]MBT7933611.1 molybdate ABC transporter permease subunit [Thiotrichales bacterium]